MVYCLLLAVIAISFVKITMLVFLSCLNACERLCNVTHGVLWVGVYNFITEAYTP